MSILAFRGAETKAQVLARLAEAADELIRLLHTAPIPASA